MKENIINFIFTKLYILISFLIFSFILSLIIYYFINNIIAIIIFVILLSLIFLYYYYIFKDSFLIFTTRRVIKQIRTGIFSKHRKELKIMDIKSSLSNKK
jgi:4-amino-4-deoxy-L-arabinose transferase-like glycosyltransferase